MNTKTLLKIGKAVVEIAGIAVPLASKYFKDKELDEQISKKVAQEVAKIMEKQVKES